jgi:hypothetical protein
LGEAAPGTLVRTGKALTTLSSRLTFLYKAVFPIVWICGFGLGTIAMWMSSASPVTQKWGFAVAWYLGTFFICRICVPLKRLRTDDRNLYVSNYLKEITVPASLVDSVTENRLINIHPVSIHLRSDTDLGSKIVFMPKARFTFTWMSHPVVDEIKRLAQTAAAGGTQ